MGVDMAFRPSAKGAAATAQERRKKAARRTRLVRTKFASTKSRRKLFITGVTPTQNHGWHATGSPPPICPQEARLRCGVFHARRPKRGTAAVG